MAKETAVSIRITEEQKEEIERQAKIHGTSVSQYSREKLLDSFPADSSVNIQELKSALLDTQHSINEIARACSRSKTFSRSDYSEIMDSLKRIDAKYYELIQEIKRSNDLEYQKIVSNGR